MLCRAYFAGLVALTFAATVDPLQAAPGFLQPRYDLITTPGPLDAPAARLTGGVAGDGMGRVIRTGDVNGDDRPDLIVATDTGKIHVWFGQEGFSGDFDVVTAPPSRRPQLTLNGFAELRALAVGDMNGDSLADIVVGFKPTAGAGGNVAIVLGRSNFPPSLSLAQTGSSGATTLIHPENGVSGLAADGALLLADLNGDGRDELIVGAADAAGQGRTGSGQAYIIIGNHGFPENIQTGSASSSHATVTGASAGDALTAGGAMHAADVNGDGKSDLILGAPQADGPSNTRSAAGEAYVVLGRTALYPGQELDLANQGTYHGASLTIYGAMAADALTLGGKITSGDVNGDGIQDILLSSPSAQGTHTTRVQAGQVYAVLGRSSFPARLDMRHSGSVKPDPTAGGADLILYGADKSHALTQGGALAVGDVNADGVDDIIAGAHAAFNTVSGGTNAGQVYVVFGRRNLLTQPALIDAKPNSQVEPDVVISGARMDDHLSRGGALLTADLDGDGVADIIVGSDAASGSGGTRVGAGRTYVILGRPTFRPQLNLLQEGDQDDGANAHVLGGTAGDALTQGGALAVADINDDGDIDLIVGAPAADGPGDGRLGAGEVYVVRGVSRQEIAVLDPAGMHMTNDGMVDLGEVGLGAKVTFPYVIRNTGRKDLAISSAFFQGQHGSLFSDSAPIGDTIAAEESYPFDINFTPNALGVKTTDLIIGSSDTDENPFRLHLRVTVVKAEPPAVKTLTAVPDVTTAAVSGQVDPKGNARRVFFDYGLTTAYGNTIEAAPVAANAPANTQVTATLTNLTPHTRYHFRIRALSYDGTASGSNGTFVTLNNAPLAQDDYYAVAHSSTITLHVLTNDSDADDDSLSLASITPPKVGDTPRGKVTKNGNTLVFTAPADPALIETISFTYTIKDAFGGTSTATVSIDPVSATIDPPMIERAAAGGTHLVTVTSTGEWSINESVSWITASIRENDPTLVDIVLLPNNSLSARTAEILVAGQVHKVTQLAATQPSLTLGGDSVYPSQVGSYYVKFILIGNGPATLTVTGLPSGLTIDRFGVISGVPTRGGTYPVTVKARNVAGEATPLQFNIVIAPLHENFAGTYLGYVEWTGLSNNAQGARLEVTTTASGGISGRIIGSRTTRSFTSRIQPETGDADHPRAFITLSASGFGIFLEFDAPQQTFTGQMAESGAPRIIGWRNGWNAATKSATAFGGLHSFSLAPYPSGSSLPQGYGFGSFKVNEGTGAVTVSGKLADDSAFTTTGFIGQQGQVLIYQPLYGKQGMFHGVLAVTAGATTAENSIAGFEPFQPRWFKPTSPKDRLYASGLWNLTPAVQGGAYPAPPAGGVVMGLANEDDNARIRFAYSDLATEDVHGLNIRNPSATGLVNKVTPTTPVSNRLNLPALNAATGAFSGDFTLAGSTAALNRKVAFTGQIVKVGDSVKGYGYYLLPELPDATGENLNNTPKWSDSVTLEAAPIE